MVKSYARRSFQRRRRPRRRFRRGGIGRHGVTTMWPGQKLVKFRAVEYFTPTGTTGAIGTVVCKANSLNDPFGTGGVALPLGLKEWAAMYKSYCVVGSRIAIRAHSSVQTGSAMFGVTLLNNSTALTTYEHYLELPVTRGKMQTSDIDHSSIVLGYGSKKFWKVRKFKDAEDLHGTITATPTATDPTDIAYYHVWVQDSNQTDTATFEVVATIEFTVLLFDPTTPTCSSL